MTVAGASPLNGGYAMLRGMPEALRSVCLVAEDSDEDFESLQRAFRRGAPDIPLER